MAPRIAYTQPQAGPQGFARTKKVYGGTINLLATDLVLNAQTAVCRVPAGFVLQNYTLTVTDLDSNGSPTLQLQLGDSASAARIMAANTVGQAPGTVTTLAASGSYYQFPADTDILLTASTASATGAAGTATIYLEGFMANP
jgi:hypothetical protein